VKADLEGSALFNFDNAVLCDRIEGTQKGLSDQYHHACIGCITVAVERSKVSWVLPSRRGTWRAVGLLYKNDVVVLAEYPELSHLPVL